MGRVSLPDHENMSTRSPLRVRGSELQSGTNDRAYECPACEYTEQEVAHG